MQVFGENKVNVHALLEQLRRQGELTLIGAETGVAENKWKRYAPSTYVMQQKMSIYWQVHRLLFKSLYKYRFMMAAGGVLSMECPARDPRKS
jgi:hypothetical protein